MSGSRELLTVTDVWKSRTRDRHRVLPFLFFFIFFWCPAVCINACHVPHVPEPVASKAQSPTVIHRQSSELHHAPAVYISVNCAIADNLLVKCSFTSTETVGFFGTGPQDGHFDVSFTQLLSSESRDLTRLILNTKHCGQ